MLAAPIECKMLVYAVCSQALFLSASVDKCSPEALQRNTEAQCLHAVL